MCYHTALIAGPEELARRFGRKADRIGDFRPAYRVCAFTHAKYPVVTADDELRLMRWGLIPFWTRASDTIVTIRNQTVNAAAESVFEHPAFRIPIRRKRCLIPASGFFGWRHEQNRKIPYYVTFEERPLVALAGVYDDWYDREKDELVSTYAVLTTEANRMMRYINNTDCRMPVVLAPGDEERWLEEALTDRQIAALLKPCSERDMYCEAVRNDFTRKVPDDPTILVSA